MGTNDKAWLAWRKSLKAVAKSLGDEASRAQGRRLGRRLMRLAEGEAAAAGDLIFTSPKTKAAALLPDPPGPISDSELESLPPDAKDSEAQGKLAASPTAPPVLASVPVA